LAELLIRQEAGETIDPAELGSKVETATAQVIRKQVEAGVDVGNDGEQSRVGFQTYVPRCLCGYGEESKRPPSRDQIEFPSYVTDGTALSALRARAERGRRAVRRPICKQCSDQ
jgi:5-methyltetrahydropteroyltriglutamate--homocysteine methyltransferase